MDNLELWESVCKTDPNHTKKVSQRGGFTAIDAHYQIESATKVFGPIGTGWGFTSGEPIFQNSVVIVPVTLWHSDRANTFGPIYGCAEMFGKRVDADAPKKATTDAITKALSMLGFNADVFLGKFDDNKYVQEVTAEFNKPSFTLDDNAKGWVHDIINNPEVAKDLDEGDYKQFILNEVKKAP